MKKKGVLMEKRNEYLPKKEIHHHRWSFFKNHTVQLCDVCGEHGNNCRCERCVCQHDWHPYAPRDGKWQQCSKCKGVRLTPTDWVHNEVVA